MTKFESEIYLENEKKCGIGFLLEPCPGTKLETFLGHQTVFLISKNLSLENSFLVGKKSLRAYNR